MWPVVIVGGDPSRLGELPRRGPRLTSRGGVSMDCVAFLELLPQGPGSESFRQAFFDCASPYTTTFTVAGLMLDIAGVFVLLRDVFVAIDRETVRTREIFDSVADGDMAVIHALKDVRRDPDKAPRRTRRRVRRRWSRARDQAADHFDSLAIRYTATRVGLLLLVAGFGLQIIGALLR